MSTQNYLVSQAQAAEAEELTTKHIEAIRKVSEDHPEWELTMSSPIHGEVHFEVKADYVHQVLEVIKAVQR